MKLLLDTHTLLWWLQKFPSLSKRASRLISETDNQIFVSAATGWELAIKSNSGKLEIGNILEGFEDALAEEGMSVLPMSMEHALRAGRLPNHHKDPFDRMLVAQAQADNLSLISNDKIFERYGVRRVW